MNDFIIIDDDPINNLICTRFIQKLFPGSAVLTFTNPVNAIGEMKNKYAMPEVNNAIVFLDINMPELNGWEVLDQIDTFEEPLKKHFTIYILSSSVDALDKQKAGRNPHVSGYIVKPLSKNILENLFTAPPFTTG